MKRAVLLVLMAGCGDDGGSKPDVFINQGPDYDLSCLDHMITSVPTTISLGGTVFDVTGITQPLPKVSMPTITARTLTDNAMVGMAMGDMDGKFSLDITTSGSATRLDYELTATGFATAHIFNSLAPWMSSLDGANFPMVQQSRLDALATALGQTLDPAKGVVEIWANDCSIRGELPMVTLQLDGATVPWAMYGGVGVWIPRDETLPHPQNLGVGSVAATVNVAPGLHTVTLNNGSLTLSSTLNVTANAWNELTIVPGHPL